MSSLTSFAIFGFFSRQKHCAAFLEYFHWSDEIIQTKTFIAGPRTPPRPFAPTIPPTWPQPPTTPSRWINAYIHNKYYSIILTKIHFYTLFLHLSSERLILLLTEIEFAIKSTSPFYITLLPYQFIWGDPTSLIKYARLWITICNLF